jgi:hypothetical protein
VDLTRHPKFPLAYGELASSRVPHWGGNQMWPSQCVKLNFVVS